MSICLQPDTFTVENNRGMVSLEANTGYPLEGGGLARRRYQRGELFLRGTREKVWVGRWREDVIHPKAKATGLASAPQSPSIQ